MQQSAYAFGASLTQQAFRQLDLESYLAGVEIALGYQTNHWVLDATAFAQGRIDVGVMLLRRDDGQDAH